MFFQMLPEVRFVSMAASPFFFDLRIINITTVVRSSIFLEKLCMNDVFFSCVSRLRRAIIRLTHFCSIC